MEGLCGSDALEAAAELRDLLNDSTCVNARKSGVGAVECVSATPAVREPCLTSRRETRLLRIHLL